MASILRMPAETELSLVIKNMPTHRCFGMCATAQLVIRDLYHPNHLSILFAKEAIAPAFWLRPWCSVGLNARVLLTLS